jgi:DNA polymerase III alpha subunit (gram-positive type)
MLHRCGNSVFSCEEQENGTLLLTLEEYDMEVNFCPFCGWRASREGQYLGVPLKGFVGFKSYEDAYGEEA